MCHACSTPRARPGTEPSPRVLIHPGSGSPGKNWPLDRYLHLVRRLRAEVRPVGVLLGEVEQSRWPAEIHRQIEAAAPVVRPATLLELMSEMLGASAFVGNDSGPGHLAAILGIPTLSLFGPTDPARWLPLGPRVDAIRGEPLDSLGVDVVVERMRRFIG